MPNAPGTLANPHWLQGDDLTGTEFGWWKVIRQVDKPPDATIKFRGTWWLCRCRCGTERVIPRQYIVSRQTGSCGCRKRKKTKPDVKKLTPKPKKRKAAQGNIRRVWPSILTSWSKSANVPSAARPLNA